MDRDVIMQIHTVPEILSRYGVETVRGRCKAICHLGNNYTAKVSRNAYFCFKCDRLMSIFDIVMHFEGCDFKDACRMLGGDDKPTFTAIMRAKKAKREREKKADRMAELELGLKTARMTMWACRELLKCLSPDDDGYAFIYDKLQYNEYLLDQYIGDYADEYRIRNR